MSEVITKGTVRAIKDGFVFIEFKTGEACGGCALKNTCTKTKELKIADDKKYVIGQEVEISGTGNGVLFSSFLAYIIPLLLVLSVLFTVLTITDNETLSAILSLLSIPVYYAGLFAFRHIWHKKLQIKVR
ncbi:MAG: SoxR reducing system RseC family protein [Alphaproteobacteria bacterium]|nr:SoxR reducing system RseC family protein [Alphaproteobacteria bacterium]